MIPGDRSTGCRTSTERAGGFGQGARKVASPVPDLDQARHSDTDGTFGIQVASGVEYTPTEDHEVIGLSLKQTG